MLALHNTHMLNVHELKAQDLHGLSPSSLAEVAAQMLQRISEQSKQIAAQAQAIKFRDVKIERITFELARLKAWKFAAKTEAMNAEQRQLFEETLAADEASLAAQLEALQAQAGAPLDAAPVEARRRPKRQALPEHLVRVEHHHEPEDTTCPSPDCGQPMVRVGEDVSERLDIVPAQFFVHRHIRGLSGGGAPAPDVGLPLLPGAGAGTRGAASHRQRHARRRPGGAHPGQPLR